MPNVILGIMLTVHMMIGSVQADLRNGSIQRGTMGTQRCAQKRCAIWPGKRVGRPFRPTFFASRSRKKAMSTASQPQLRTALLERCKHRIIKRKLWTYLPERADRNASVIKKWQYRSTQTTAASTRRARECASVGAAHDGSNFTATARPTLGCKRAQRAQRGKGTTTAARRQYQHDTARHFRCQQWCQALTREPSALLAGYTQDIEQGSDRSRNRKPQMLI